MDPDEFDLVAYAAWGQRFFDTVVTAERVLAGVNAMAGRPIDVGPLGVGPGRLAKVRATGTIGTATGRRADVEPLRFDVVVPVELTFSLDLTMDRQHFDAAIEIPLVIHARAREDLAIVLDVTPPATADVAVDLRARGLRAQVTNRAAGIEGELQRFVARFVRRELEGETVRRATVIDVAAAIDRAGAALAGGHRTSEEAPR